MLGIRNYDLIPDLIFTGQFDADLESWVLPRLNPNKFCVRAVVFMVNEQKRSLATISRRLDRLFELVGENAPEGIGTRWAKLKDCCPGCGRKYDAILAQEGDD